MKRSATSPYLEDLSDAPSSDLQPPPLRTVGGPNGLVEAPAAAAAPKGLAAGPSGAGPAGGAAKGPGGGPGAGPGGGPGGGPKGGLSSEVVRPVRPRPSPVPRKIGYSNAQIK